MRWKLHRVLLYPQLLLLLSQAVMSQMCCQKQHLIGTFRDFTCHSFTKLYNIKHIAFTLYLGAIILWDNSFREHMDSQSQIESLESQLTTARRLPQIIQP